MRAQKEIEGLSRFPAENPHPVLRVGVDGTLLFANRSAEPLLECWGCQVGRSLPADWIERIADATATGVQHEWEMACSGRAYTVTIASFPEGGYANLYGHEITDRKLVEERITHLNRVLKAIRNVNQLIVREKEPQKLIEQACDLLVETRGFRGGS